MKRGFGSPNYDRTKAREVQRKGAQALRDQGKAHRWTSDSARAASAKGRGTVVPEEKQAA